MRIALSTGHGFRDPGATRGDLYEHLIAYQISWRLVEALTDRGHTVEFISCFQPLSGKIKQVNASHKLHPFDLAMEIHLNSSANPQANGTEVLHYSNKNKLLAARVSQSIESSIGLRDRGAVKRTGLGFLTKTAPPALIIETMFISSSIDTSAIDVTFYRRMAEAIANCL